MTKKETAPKGAKEKKSKAKAAQSESIIFDDTQRAEAMDGLKKAIEETAPEVKPEEPAPEAKAEETAPENAPEVEKLNLDIDGSPEEKTAEQAPEEAPELTAAGKPKKKRLTRPELRAKKEALARAAQNGSATAANAKTAPNPLGEDKQETTAAAEVESTLTLANAFPSGGLLTIVDKFMSVVLPLAINSMANTKLSQEDFALDASEKKAISPAIDAAAKTIPLDFGNPWTNLAIVIVGVYSSKVIAGVNIGLVPKKRI